MITVEVVKTGADAEELDELLWNALWLPLDFPREARRGFSVSGEEFELIAKRNGQIAGGLVAVWTGDTEIELRHLAVASNAERKGVGRSLLAELLRIAASKKCHRIRTIARNTPVGFFGELGFQKAQGLAPEHALQLS